jgi:signal transduction histidine kinase/CheY-like chemotaxis protein/HPt (histidine-containing phosphotransfer) domain-containing protein
MHPLTTLKRHARRAFARGLRLATHIGSGSGIDRQPRMESLNTQYAALRQMLSVTNASSPRDLQQLLVDATDACRLGLCADRVTVWLRDKTGRVLELQAYSEINEQMRPSSNVISVADSQLLLDAVAKREVVATDDASIMPHLRELFSRHPGLRATKSRLDAPILIDGELAGVLIVSMASRRVAWTQPQIQFAREMAALITLGLERRERLRAEAQLLAANTSLTAELERRSQSDQVAVERQRVLAALIQAADDPARGLESVAQEVCDRLRQDLRVERVVVWQRGTNTDYQPVAISDSDPLIQPALPLNSSYFFSDYDAAMLGGAPLLAKDVTKAPHLVETLANLPFTRLIKSRIDVPILRDGRLDGMLICSSRFVERDWTKDDAMFAAAVGNVLSILFERRERQSFERQLINVNTRLVIEVDRRTEVDRTLKRRQALLDTFNRNIGAELNGGPDALKAIADSVRFEFAIERVAVWLYADDAAQKCEGVIVSDADPTAEPVDTTWQIAGTPVYLEALRTGQPLLAPNVATAAYLAELQPTLPTSRTAKSRIDIPILRDGRFAGMMICSSRARSIEWSLEDALFGTGIGSAIAILLEQRERQRIERELRETNALLATEITRKIESDRSIKLQQAVLSELVQASSDAGRPADGAIKLVTDAVRETLGIERVSLWLGSEDRSDCRVVATSDVGNTLPAVGQNFPFPAVPKFLAALEKGVPLRANDVLSAPHLTELIATFPVMRLAKSRIDVPIMRDGQLIGMMICVSVEQTRHWTNEEALFCAAIASVTSVLLERRERQRYSEELIAANASLMLENSRRQERHAAMQVHQDELAELVQQASDAGRQIEDTYQSLVDRVRTALNADIVSLWLGTTDAPTCKIQAVSADINTAPIVAGAVFPTPSAPDYYKALELGQPQAASDITTAAHLKTLSAIFGGILKEKSRVDVPIMHDGRLVGMIVVTTTHLQRSWSREELLFCSAIAGVTSVLIERHHRQMVEQELRRANAEVLAANKAKSLFLANMSHEIRTPMNGVFGMTDLLLRTELTERQTRLVQIVNQSARTLLTIINDILDLSRIEAGKLELDVQDFDLYRTMEGVVELLVDDAQRKSLDLSLYIAPEVPRALSGDAARLRQICINLIGNAVKFTSVGEVAVRLAWSATGLTIEVRDTGIGIPPEIQARLFQPFAQGDSSITRRFGGTGLGLSISMHLAQLMSGRVSLTSSPGAGTTVRLDLPLARAKTDIVTSTIETSLEGRRLLIVDDRASNREIMASYLEAAGATCDAVSTADAALTEAKRAAEQTEPYAAIVVDMVMPGTDGLGLVQKLRSDPSHANVGIVMVTSLSWKGDQRTVRALGVQAFMTKPVRRDELVAAVSRAIQQRGVVDQAHSVAAVTAPAALPRFNAHVLIAEDNPVNVEVAREHLTQVGITVDVAENGLQAIRLLASNRYDLVLMDCQMPQLDGLEATRRLRAIELRTNRQRIPVIAVTANAYEADRVACLEAGMDDYLSKPFTEQTLVARLSHWLKDTGTAAPAIEAAHEVQRLDSARIAELRAVTATLFPRVAAAYVTHSPRLITELIEAAATGNVAALQTAAHNLKSSSANVGAAHLAQLCGSLEEAARQHRIDSAVTEVRDIAHEFRAVGLALEQELKRAS